MSLLSWSPLCPICFLWLGSGTGQSKGFPWLLGSRVPSSSSISSFLCLLGDLFLFRLPHYSPPLHLRIQLHAAQLPAHSFLELHPYSCLSQFLGPHVIQLFAHSFLGLHATQLSAHSFVQIFPLVVLSSSGLHFSSMRHFLLHGNRAVCLGSSIQISRTSSCTLLRTGVGRITLCLPSSDSPTLFF